MKFEIGDKAIIIKSGNEDFLPHFLKIGDTVEITGFYSGWKFKKYNEAYYVKCYTEPLLAEELEMV